MNVLVFVVATLTIALPADTKAPVAGGRGGRGGGRGGGNGGNSGPDAWWRW
jgi:hypothetical protein